MLCLSFGFSSSSFLYICSLHPDCLKVNHVAHGLKSFNMVVNLSDEIGFIDLDQPLIASNVGHETEISMFSLAEYNEFAENPETKWE